MKRFFKLILITIFLSITVLSVRAAFVEDGLLLYFGFDEVQGETVKDMSGNNHNGTLQEGAEIVKDVVKYGKGALRIEGGNEVMAVETFKELEEYQDNTFLFWIYFTDPASGGWDQILAKTAPGSDRSPGLWVETGGLGIHYRYNPGNQGFWGLGPDGDRTHFETNQWHHVAGVKEGGELIGYVDGEQKAKIGVPETHTQGAGGLYVGDSPAYAGPAAKFIMDDLVVYNRALTKDEVGKVMEGFLQLVDAQGKLASTWGDIKRQH